MLTTVGVGDIEQVSILIKSCSDLGHHSVQIQEKYDTNIYAQIEVDLAKKTADFVQVAALV